MSLWLFCALFMEAWPAVSHSLMVVMKETHHDLQDG